jgi:hypothetical protein
MAWNDNMKTILVFFLPVIALVLTFWHHSDMINNMKCEASGKTCKKYAIPLTATLHGVLSPRVANKYIMYTEASGVENDAYSEMETLHILNMSKEQLEKRAFKLYTGNFAGEPYKMSKDINAFNTKCSLAAPDGLGQDASCVLDVRKMYAAYALGCYTQTTMDTDYTKSPACKCLDNVWDNMPHLTKITNVEDRLSEFIHAARFCSTRNENVYTVDYAGVLNTHGLAINGMFFLVWGLFSIATRMATLDGAKLKKHSPQTNAFFLFFCTFAQMGMILLVVWYSTQENTFTDKDPGHAIMSLRPQGSEMTSYSKTGNKYIPVTKDENHMGPRFMSTQSLLQSILWVAFVLQTVIVLAWWMTYYYRTADANYVIYSTIFARIGTDLPFIAGFTLLGISVLVQNGYTNYSYLDYKFFILVAICLLQHVSNVTKLFYDAICRNTDSSVFKMLNYKDETENDDSDDKRQKITTVLQFFGWIRVWVFILVTTGCFVVLTGTNELTKSTPVGNFTQSQVFFFVIALYLSNVTYDIVRELLPVQFEKHDADSARLWVVSIYIAYYVANQRLYMDKMSA